MKLELKHLAAYLPFKIDAIHHVYGKIKLEGLYLWGHLYNNEYGEIELEEIKPILRPLSDLTKQIEHNGDKFVPIDFLAGRYNSECGEFLYRFKNNLSNIEDAPYTIINKLLEWHFDIFGLIEKGLAIDINTL